MVESFYGHYSNMKALEKADAFKLNIFLVSLFHWISRCTRAKEAEDVESKERLVKIKHLIGLKYLRAYQRTGIVEASPEVFEHEYSCIVHVVFVLFHFKFI